ncbi:hypothetical protein G3495_18705 [Shewanella baltica]|uniref:hypothetical protein n=1 Tax=Shewanella baltica TaxID=62322 RepID=UPI00217D49C8|nr:hypothetical protein [Shewanella baltica]MCS6237121.1 hypothetical protein [Shewanella baltica]MCS6272559.1 hypothetical protein [Shewanella baltica]
MKKKINSAVVVTSSQAAKLHEALIQLEDRLDKLTLKIEKFERSQCIELASISNFSAKEINENLENLVQKMELSEPVSELELLRPKSERKNLNLSIMENFSRSFLAAAHEPKIS